MSLAVIRVVVASIVAACTLLVALPEAAIVPCSGVEGTGFKVLLDDITAMGAAAASPLMLPLIHRLDANLEQLKIETGLPLTIVRCAKRRPDDPAEFRRPLLEDLNARQVVLEVWGTTTEVNEGGNRYQEASIGYALIPVRFYEYNSPKPPGVFEVPRRARALSSVDELVKLVDQSGSLAAYVTVAAGTRLLRVRNYDLARTQLCKADALLTALRPRLATADAALLEYARKLAGEAVTQARQDSGYDGALKRLPISPALSCGGHP